MGFPFEPDKTSDVPLWVQLRQRLVYLVYLALVSKLIEGGKVAVSTAAASEAQAS